MEKAKKYAKRGGLIGVVAIAYIGMYIVGYAVGILVNKLLTRHW